VNLPQKYILRSIVFIGRAKLFFLKFYVDFETYLLLNNACSFISYSIADGCTFLFIKIFKKIHIKI